MATLGSIILSNWQSKVAYTPGRYTEFKKIPKEDCGKNTGITLMYSMSRNKPDTKKLWISKPFFNMGGYNKYELPTATNEVFFGELAVALFGGRTAKTKFNPQVRGVISRVLGDDDSKVTDLLNFCNTNKTLSQQAQQTLLATIIYGLIIEDRDLHLENLIIKFGCYTKDDIVYGIDHEFAVSSAIADRISFNDMVTGIDKNIRVIIRLLLDENFKWNVLPRTDKLSERDLEIFSQRFLGMLTNTEFINALQLIIEALAFDDFKICYDAKEKIYKALCQNKTIYSAEEIDNIVVPNIDAAIVVVKKNVAIAKQFIDNKNLQYKTTSKCKL